MMAVGVVTLVVFLALVMTFIGQRMGRVGIVPLRPFREDFGQVLRALSYGMIGTGFVLGAAYGLDQVI